MTRFIPIILFLLIPAFSTAQTFPDRTDRFVNDFADVIDPAKTKRIAAALDAFQTDHGVEMTVVTIKRTADYGWSGSVPNLATALFKHWRVGTTPRDNTGALMVLSIGDREVFIALGNSYPPAYNARMDAVFDHSMKTRLQRELYGDAVEAGVAETIYQLSNSDGTMPQQNPIPAVMTWLALALGGAVAIKFQKKIGRFISSDLICPKCEQKTLLLETHRDTLDPGVEIVETTCSNCDHRDKSFRPYVAKSHFRFSSSGGGGFSSGGGGGGRF